MVDDLDMPSMTPGERRADTGAFLVHLQHLFATDTDWNDGMQWVGGRALTDDVAVVLYRNRPGGPVLGRRYDLGAERALFTDDSAEAIAGEAWTGDFVDPSGPGELLPVDWAGGLCDAHGACGGSVRHREDRGWVRTAPARSEDRDGVDGDAGQSGDPRRRDAEEEVVAAESSRCARTTSAPTG
jgi:hypothetical protein